jgi:hypothetical protein
MRMLILPLTKSPVDMIAVLERMLEQMMSTSQRRNKHLSANTLQHKFWLTLDVFIPDDF